MPSLRDVARELNVSVSLVSKVLNNRLGTTCVRDELVAAIHATAKRIGYRKNYNALSLLARRQNSLAVFVHRLGAPGSGMVEKLVEGIADAAGEHSQRMFLHFFRTAKEFREKSKGLHSGMVDGLIVTGVTHPDLAADLQAIQRGGVAVVTVYNEPVHSALVNIGIPNEDLSDAATTHLIQRGCRRILHLSVLASRAYGHRRALRRAGIPQRRELFVELPAPSGFWVEAGRKAVRKLLDAGVKFDGISAQSDAQAVGALNELVSRGIRVPEEVRIAGIDNAPFAELSIVPLTSVSQRLVERGRIAVETMVRHVGGGAMASRNLEALVRARESTAP